MPQCRINRTFVLPSLIDFVIVVVVCSPQQVRISMARSRPSNTLRHFLR